MDKTVRGLVLCTARVVHVYLRGSVLASMVRDGSVFWRGAGDMPDGSRAPC